LQSMLPFASFWRSLLYCFCRFDPTQILWFGKVRGPKLYLPASLSSYMSLLLSFRSLSNNIHILLNLLMAFSSIVSQDLNYTNWGSWVEYDIKSGQLVQFRPRIEPVVMPDWKVGEVIFWFWCLYINFLLDMASQ
jgi:hypothetical protein